VSRSEGRMPPYPYLDGSNPEVAKSIAKLKRDQAREGQAHQRQRTRKRRADDEGESLEKSAGSHLGPLVWIADAKPVLSQDYVIADLLNAGAFCVVYGDSNCGKTYFVLDACLHVASGQLWRGQRVKRGLVVYVAAEGGAGFRNRLAGYRIHAEWCASASLAFLPQAIDLLDPNADTNALVDLIRSAESDAGETAAVVVVDTLARVIPGGNENASDGMSQFVANIDRIRAETGAAVMVVHHTGKDATKGARGHSSLRAAADTEILVEGQEGTRQVTVTKQRDMAGGQRFGFDLVSVEIGRDPETGASVTACVVAHKDAPQAPARRGPTGMQQVAILRLVEAEAASGRAVLPGGDIVRLARERLGIGKTSAHSAVTSLTEQGFLQPTIGGLRLPPAESEG
jgi:KaiC/GvpD/RAD55 family RecA-like ATPase